MAGLELAGGLGAGMVNNSAFGGEYVAFVVAGNVIYLRYAYVADQCDGAVCSPDRSDFRLLPRMPV